MATKQTQVWKNTQKRGKPNFQEFSHWQNYFQTKPKLCPRDSHLLRTVEIDNSVTREELYGLSLATPKDTGYPWTLTVHWNYVDNGRIQSYKIIWSSLAKDTLKLWTACWMSFAKMLHGLIFSCFYQNLSCGPWLQFSSCLYSCPGPTRISKKVRPRRNAILPACVEQK